MRKIKHLLDFFLAFVLLLCLSPTFLLVAMIIWMRLGRPIFFSQIRPGFRARPFRIYKFRTMTMERDKQGNLFPDEQRLKFLGKTLRALSLDELPQLINVLKGELSLVGPRPLLMEYIPLYTVREKKRHQVRPGITGWAQINGRNSINWKQKFELDIWYVENWSLWLDLKILFLTALKVIRRSGIQNSELVTMPPYDGHE